MPTLTLTPPPATTPALYAQDGKGREAIVHAHYFIGGCDWYATEYDPATGEAFGWAELFPGGGELGYFSLAELDAVRVGPLGFRVEYELDWEPRPLSQVLAERGR
jgi:hypothetical protein